jgi:hypothetical protein
MYDQERDIMDEKLRTIHQEFFKHCDDEDKEGEPDV